ncbi:MAG TPA: rhomboid family protein [Verrucomicrobiae bacterium]|nr:rhomboid family protein [Verrucomicrobiae bacterium]
MQTLAQQRCFNHVGREAVARCPECGQCFCRECITEHDDRVVCAVCLKKLTRQPLARHITFTWFLRLVQCAFGVLMAWFFFFLIGESLLRLPDSFHEGTLWQVPWVDKE